MPVTFLRFLKHKADWALYYELSRTTQVDPSDPNALSEFNSGVLRIAAASISENSQRWRRTVPWWNEELASLLQDQRRALQRLRRTPPIENFIELKQLSAKLKYTTNRAKEKREPQTYI